MNKTKFKIAPFLQKVIKPWGYEFILSSPQANVTSKIIHINEGARFSLQYHDQKEEVLTLINGEVLLYLEDQNGVLQEINMEPQKGYHIRPFQKHRCKGITNCNILESSTKEEGNTVRLEDDYNRGTETEEARKKRGEKKVYMG